MNIVLNKKGCQKNNISLNEVLLLLAIYNKIDYTKTHESLITNGFITADRDKDYCQIGWRLTRKGTDLIDSVVVDSDKSEKSEEDLINLADRLKKVFPSGKKVGTSNYWAEGKALIVKRLKAFFKKYGTEYSDDQIVEAAQRYVDNFNGQYQYMRTLKYFIFKDKDINGEREYTSDLLNYLENTEQGESLGNDWNTELV